MKNLEPWVRDVLADPVTKLPATPEQIGIKGGVIDARRYLPNTPGFVGWQDGQAFYEGWHDGQHDPVALRAEIEGVRPVYEHIVMTGRVLDVGGHLGLVREFLKPDVQFVSVDKPLGHLSKENPRPPFGSGDRRRGESRHPA